MKTGALDTLSALRLLAESSEAYVAAMQRVFGAMLEDAAPERAAAVAALEVAAARLAEALMAARSVLAVAAAEEPRA